MSDHSFNFTQAAIRNLTPPDVARWDNYRDTGVKDLWIRVQRSGFRSFYLYKKIKGRPRWIHLGKYPDLSVEAARKLAAIKLGEVAQGKDPHEETRSYKSENTLGDLYSEYMTRYSKKHKKSWKYDEREIPKFLGHWFTRKISEIKKYEIQSLLEQIYDDNGLYQSNRMLERLKAMYNKAIEWGWKGQNPVVGIKKYKEKSRDRFILPNEMPHLAKALNEESNITARDYILTLLYTGARRTNTLKMRWDQIDWNFRTWRIPDTKNGDPQLVPLSESAVSILQRRFESARSDWVFPSEIDPTKHFVNFKRAWNSIRLKATINFWRDQPSSKDFITERDTLSASYSDVQATYRRIVARAKKKNIELSSGLIDLRLHDIRRTLGSYQAITGSSLRVIGESLGHRSSQSTQVYARLNLDPIRESVERAISVIRMNMTETKM
ncbi:tyrosine-type recombinase/integrase [Nostoc ellipsosporum NOK]|nr:tyrosine-type recombinase/integrase [Nostoc ellipsosporum NOK]